MVTDKFQKLHIWPNHKGLDRLKTFTAQPIFMCVRFADLENRRLVFKHNWHRDGLAYITFSLIRKTINRLSSEDLSIPPRRGIVCLESLSYCSLHGRVIILLNKPNEYNFQPFQAWLGTDRVRMIYRVK